MLPWSAPDLILAANTEFECVLNTTEWKDSIILLNHVLCKPLKKLTSMNSSVVHTTLS